MWLTLSHLLRIVAQGIAFGGDGRHGRQRGIGRAFLHDQLPADFRRTQAGRETVGTALGVGLTLAIDNGADVWQQVREMGFHPLATACRKGIEAGEPALQFVGPFAHGHPAPPEFAFRTPLSPGPQFFDGAGHKQPSGTALECLRRLNKQRLDRSREFHGKPSRTYVPRVYHILG